MAKSTDIISAWLNRTLDKEFLFIRLFEEHAREIEMQDPDMSEELIRRRNTESEHARMLGDEIASLGSKAKTTGPVEDLAGKIIWGMEEGLANDAEVRHLADEWTAEQELIGYLTAAAAGARAVNLSEIAGRLDAMLAEKRGTAAWLEEQLASTAKKFLESLI